MLELKTATNSWLKHMWTKYFLLVMVCLVRIARGHSADPLMQADAVVMTKCHELLLKNWGEVSTDMSQISFLFRKFWQIAEKIILWLVEFTQPIFRTLTNKSLVQSTVRLLPWNQPSQLTVLELLWNGTAGQGPFPSRASSFIMNHRVAASILA